MTEISFQIPLSVDLRERWEKFIYDRGYAKGGFIRAFIEAVTDPVRGPQVERVIQNIEPSPVYRRNKKASAVNRRGRRHGGGGNKTKGGLSHG